MERGLSDLCVQRRGLGVPRNNNYGTILIKSTWSYTSLLRNSHTYMTPENSSFLVKIFCKPFYYLWCLEETICEEYPAFNFHMIICMCTKMSLI